MAQDGQLFAFDLQGRYSEEDGHIVDAHSACSECHISWVSYIPYPLSTGQGMCYISEVAYPCVPAQYSLWKEFLYGRG